jgi:hypothetical protein
LDAAARVGTSEDVRARLAWYFRCWVLVALDRFGDASAVADDGIAAAQRDRQNWALHIFEAWKGLQGVLAGRLTNAAVALDGASAVATRTSWSGSSTRPACPGSVG